MAVGVDLIDHVEQRVAGSDQEALLTIRGEAHVVGSQRAALGTRHRFLAERLHVERRVALAVGLQHACVEHSDGEHVAQAAPELLGVEGAGPRPDRVALDVEYADHVGTEVEDVGRRNVDRWAAHFAGPVDQQVAKGRLVTRSSERLGNSQPKWLSHDASHDPQRISVHPAISPEVLSGVPNGPSSRTDDTTPGAEMRSRYYAWPDSRYSMRRRVASSLSP